VLEKLIQNETGDRGPDQAARPVEPCISVFMNLTTDNPSLCSPFVMIGKGRGVKVVDARCWPEALFTQNRHARLRGAERHGEARERDTSNIRHSAPVSPEAGFGLSTVATSGAQRVKMGGSPQCQNSQRRLAEVYLPRFYCTLKARS
jgi:hypothetical protein